VALGGECNYAILPRIDSAGHATRINRPIEVIRKAGSVNTMLASESYRLTSNCAGEVTCVEFTAMGSLQLGAILSAGKDRIAADCRQA